MKNLLIVLFSFYIFSAEAQTVDSLGINNNPLLNNSEVTYFNSLPCNTKLSGFTFQNKRIAFVTGSSCNNIVGKKHYFTDGKDGLCNLMILSDHEKQLTGYDAILFSWCKIKMSDKRKQKLLKALSTYQNKGN